MAVQDVVTSLDLAAPSSGKVTWRLPEGDELPAGWMLTRLSEVCVTGARSLSPQDFPHEVFEYYSIPAFQETGTPAFETGERILSNKLLVERGAVLFGKLNPRVLKVWMVNPTGSHRTIASTEFLPMLAKDKATPEFLFYLCHSGFVVQEAMRMVNGSTPSRQRVDPQSFYSITVPLPPLPEQRAIARALRAVQDAIRARCSEVELERERKAALMQRLFTHGTRSEPTKQTEIGEMPESWQVVRLGAKAYVVTKGSSPKWQGFDYAQEGIVFVRAQNVGWGRLELEDIVHLPAEFNSKERKSVLQVDDILVTIAGTIGRVAVSTEQVAGGNVNQAVAVIRLDDSYLPSFLANFLLTEAGQAQLHGRAKEVIQANVSLEDIKNLAVPAVAREEQVDIVKSLHACDAKISVLEREVALHKELFRALLEELMTGRLSALPLVEAADDEAEVRA